jgi:hypothetical protein
VIFVEERVIAVVVALHRRGVRAARRVNHGGDPEAGYQNAIRVAANNLGRDNLLGDDDDGASCQRGLLADTQVAPGMRIALNVGALDVDDRHVGC